MNKSPVIGIILVNYNGYQLTLECLESLNECVNDNVFIYIVDNASSDNSCVELKKYMKTMGDFHLDLIESKENLGFAGGNNLAIMQAVSEGTDYVILLNNDTVVDKDFIEHLIEPFDLHDDCYAAVSKIYYEGNPNQIWYAGGLFSFKTAKVVHYRYDEIDDGRVEEIQKVTFATGCCLCISKECIQQIGMLSEDYFLYDEDTDYCLKILNSKHSIYYAPKSIIYHKVNASTKKKKGMVDFYMTRNRIWLIKKYIKKGRLRAYMACGLTYLYRCIKGQMSFKFFVRGSIEGMKSSPDKKV
jgi:hypothetical protein